MGFDFAFHFSGQRAQASDDVGMVLRNVFGFANIFREVEEGWAGRSGIRFLPLGFRFGLLTGCGW
jgi:hypothetical protein